MLTRERGRKKRRRRRRKGQTGREKKSVLWLFWTWFALLVKESQARTSVTLITSRRWCTSVLASLDVRRCSKRTKPGRVHVGELRYTCKPPADRQETDQEDSSECTVARVCVCLCAFVTVKWCSLLRGWVWSSDREQLLRTEIVSLDSFI